MTSTNSAEEREALPKHKAFHRLFIENKVLLFLGGAAVIVVIVIITLLSRGTNLTRTESYTDVSGSAGLQATINSGKKPVSDFNVYIFKDDGQQVAVVRPDKDGNVNLALQEGDYVMLIGKRFGKDKVFPEEPLALKNGKILELKLHYQ